MTAPEPTPASSYPDFLLALVGEDPRWRPLLGEHLDANDGELLGHLFMWDLRIWAAEHVDSDPSGVDLLLDRLSTAFESGDSDVDDCISLSFLEGLPRPGEAGGGVRVRLPQALAADLQAMESSAT